MNQNFFDDESNVNEYIKLAEGYDGKELIEQYEQYLTPDAVVLEIGMGPGVDFSILEQKFVMVGSDRSQIFVDRYKKLNPQSEVYKLDAVTLNINRKFNGIYSNKVLMHLKLDQLHKSLSRQSELLLPSGVIFHSFWYGDKEEEFDGLYFRYYNEEQLRLIFSQYFDIITIEIYTEMEKNDSLFVIAKQIQT